MAPTPYLTTTKGKGLVTTVQIPTPPPVMTAGPDAMSPIPRVELFQIIAAAVIAGLAIPQRLEFFDQAHLRHPLVTLYVGHGDMAAVDGWAALFGVMGAGQWIVTSAGGHFYDVCSALVPGDASPVLFRGWYVVLRCTTTPPLQEAPAIDFANIAGAAAAA